MTGRSTAVQINVPLESDYLGLVTHFTEQGALAMGLGQPEAMRLGLASEEVFSYLARLTDPGSSFSLRLHPGGYYVRAEFRCPWSRMDLRNFNLAAEFDPLDESSLDQLGLLLAARMVDRFFLEEYEAGQFSLNLMKEKSYPHSPVPPLTPPSPLTDFKVAPPEPDRLKELAHLLPSAYAINQFPSSFASPGKLVDMVAGGEYQAMTALGPRDQLGGALLWRIDSSSTVSCYGPYLFGQPSDSPMAAALVEACLACIGRSEALSLLCRHATAQLPQAYFEFLGELELCTADGNCEPWAHYHRQLHEDSGLGVWCHPLLDDFLLDAYERLALPRDIHLAAHEGETRPPHSVFGTNLNRSQGLVTFHPVLDGLDVADNLTRHVALMRREGIRNMFMALDLGLSWQALLTPALLEAGFRPRLLLPRAGKADHVVFQHHNLPA